MELRLVGPEADDGGEPVEAWPTKLSLADARLRILAIQDAVYPILTWVAPTLLTVQGTGGTERVLAACESHSSSRLIRSRAFLSISRHVM